MSTHVSTKGDNIIPLTSDTHVSRSVTATAWLAPGVNHTCIAKAWMSQTAYIRVSKNCSALRKSLRMVTWCWHWWLLLFVGCLTSQQHVSVSQGRICSDNFTCCHTEIEVADQTFYPSQSQYTDTGPTSPSADPISPGAWQGSHWTASF